MKKSKYRVTQKFNTSTLTFNKNNVLEVSNVGKFYTTLTKGNGKKIRLANYTWQDCLALGLVA